MKWNIGDIRDCFEAQRFVRIRLSRDAQTVFNARPGHELDTSVRAWKKHWWHRARFSASEVNCYFAKIQTLRMFVVPKKRYMMDTLQTL